MVCQYENDVDVITTRHLIIIIIIIIIIIRNLYPAFGQIIHLSLICTNELNLRPYIMPKPKV